MKKSTKIILGLLLVAAIFFTIFWQNQNYSTTKGQIKLFRPKVNDTTASPQLADLTVTANLEVLQSPQSAIKVDVRIINNGPAQISGEIPFEYVILLNDQDVFSNTDSYSIMGTGDSFEFSYSILQSIHQYPQSGEIVVKVDTENAIEEGDESNNEIRLEYPIAPSP